MATSALNFQLLTMARLRHAHIGCGYDSLAVSFCLENHWMPAGLRASIIGFPVFADGCSVPISRGSPPTFVLDE